jgi:ribosomal-protein-alanine N-acetyltransferase
MLSILDTPSNRSRPEFLAAVARSRRLHRGLVTPPRTAAAFAAYLRRLRGPAYIGYWVRTDEGELAGVITISEIVRGAFKSGYLGYYAFSPHDGQGYMSRGLHAVLTEVFGAHRLHRVEANIQPGNEPSRRLVRRLGFRCEGFSPRYLKVNGRWCDHERWALTVEDWRSRLHGQALRLG